MKKLVKFLVKNITGSSDFEVESSVEDGREELVIKADQEIIGMIIGKGGKTIKNIRRLAAMRAALQDKLINISITER